METRRFKLITGGVVAAILILAVIGIHFLAPRSETAVKIFLLAETNDVAGNRFAIWGATNESAYDAVISSSFLILKTNGVEVGAVEGEFKTRLISPHSFKTYLSPALTNVEISGVVVYWAYTKFRPHEKIVSIFRRDWYGDFNSLLLHEPREPIETDFPKGRLISSEQFTNR